MASENVIPMHIPLFSPGPIQAQIFLFGAPLALKTLSAKQNTWKRRQPKA
jgi:hypothetical protein